VRKILIIAPHYPPSNLAAVHRSRLFAQHLPSFGWEPVVLTVDEQYYEEKLDWHLYELLPKGQRIEKVSAYPVTRPRLVGDIGLRAFFQLRNKALSLVRKEKINFVYIPVPSYYTSLIGPYLHRKTGVKYGIDYIDPWVHRFPGSEKVFSRHWWSTKLSAYLEPKAVRKASLITGVAEGYYKGVLERNRALEKTCVVGAMPYGGEAEDHRKVKALGLKPYLFTKKKGVLQLVYAGALLPKAYEPLEQCLKAIKEDPQLFNKVEFHFIGSGRSANDSNSHTVKPLAERYGLWQITIFEYPARIPYLDVLVHLEAADGVFILGSTEPHYTPSKVYQAILSDKPVLAVLHQFSSGCNVIRETNVGAVLTFNGEDDIASIQKSFATAFGQFKNSLHCKPVFSKTFEAFSSYSAYAVTERLVNLLNRLK
jgi:hypothetical protein